jgi:hypothetical protein
MWEQRIQLGGGASGGQLREDVGQVRKWRNAVLRAGPQQTVESGSPSGRVMRSAEEIIAPAQCDIAQLGLAQGMPPARLCRAMRMGGWIERISAPTIVADAA